VVAPSFAIEEHTFTAATIEGSIELLVAIIACKNSYQIATKAKQLMYPEP